jgi:uncharacterized phage protein gp47/JayE
MAEITNTGVVEKTATEYIQEFQDAFKGIFGSNLNVDPNTPQGQIASLLGLICTKFDQQIVDCARSLDIAQAQGQQLEDLTSILSIFRNGPVNSSVAATLSGVPYAVIPAGSQAKTTVGDIFLLRYSVAIGEDGTGEGFFVAEESGPKNVDAGTLTQIATPVAGWDTVTNVNDGTVGRDAETDAQFKRRYFNELAVGSISQLKSIISGVQAITEVESVSGAENDTGDVVEASGVRIPPNGFVIAVKGGDSDEIAAEIRRRKGIGTCSRIHVRCDMTGDANEIIPAGVRAKVLAADNPLDIDLFFYLKSDVQLNGVGVGSGYFICETEGDISFAVGKLTTIIGAPDHLDTVSNTYSERFVCHIVDVLSADGTMIQQQVPINFKRVQAVPCQIAIKLIKNSKFPADGEAQIRANIAAYFDGSDPFTERFDLDGLSVGERLYKSRLYTPVNMVIGHQVEYIHLDGKELTDQEYIDIYLDEQAVIEDPETDIIFE